jgi:4a-hydroxytetrahydrobiopterin dehydratase
MSEELANKTCIPCSGDVPKLEESEYRPLLEQLAGGWEVIGGHHLEKTFTFPDFAEALAYVNRAGAIAEEEAHHPDLHLAWGRVRVTVWTHAIDGLAEADFILAAKLDRVR